MIRRFREPDNGLTHPVGAALALAASGLPLSSALRTDSSRRVIAFAISGVGPAGLDTGSAPNHTLPLGPVGVARLRRLDHLATVVLIAGS